MNQLPFSAIQIWNAISQILSHNHTKLISNFMVFAEESARQLFDGVKIDAKHCRKSGFAFWAINRNAHYPQRRRRAFMKNDCNPVAEASRPFDAAHFYGA
jgi:hypothetical protein